MKTKLFRDILSQRESIKYLKENSPYYPEVLYEGGDTSVYVSTIVRIEREGIWYDIHCCEQLWLITQEDVVETKEVALLKCRNNALSRLMQKVYLCQLYYLIDKNNPSLDREGNHINTVSPIQIDEKTRMQGFFYTDLSQ